MYCPLQILRLCVNVITGSNAELPDSQKLLRQIVYPLVVLKAVVPACIAFLRFKLELHNGCGNIQNNAVKPLFNRICSLRFFMNAVNEPSAFSYAPFKIFGQIFLAESFQPHKTFRRRCFHGDILTLLYFVTTLFQPCKQVLKAIR